jgi:hypothetical protein
MRLFGLSAILWALIAAVTGLTSVARAQDAREIRPEVDLLKQSVSEKVQAVAERLGLTQEQRDRLRKRTAHSRLSGRRCEISVGIFTRAISSR